MLLLFEGLAKTLTTRRSLTTGVEIECFKGIYTPCVSVFPMPRLSGVYIGASFYALWYEYSESILGLFHSSISFYSSRYSYIQQLMC